ncbi:hypothetical protein C8Q74DRAFT_608834 [Fomes fomentarius]|nr:hypothetical protein C8Q74DRAFT_608834 [Fomes fomentarius]
MWPLRVSKCLRFAACLQVPSLRGQVASSCCLCMIIYTRSHHVRQLLDDLSSELAELHWPSPSVPHSYMYAPLGQRQGRDDKLAMPPWDQQAEDVKIK